MAIFPALRGHFPASRTTPGLVLLWWLPQPPCQRLLCCTISTHKLRNSPLSWRQTWWPGSRGRSKQSDQWCWPSWGWPTWLWPSCCQPGARPEW